jgi:hypothetical protein
VKGLRFRVEGIAHGAKGLADGLAASQIEEYLLEKNSSIGISRTIDIMGATVTFPNYPLCQLNSSVGHFTIVF